jgi:hypothetical protein
MLATYNWMWHNIIKDIDFELLPLVGKPQNTVRCPECGRHTIYMNMVGDEWCLHCDYGSEEDV